MWINALAILFVIGIALIIYGVIGIVLLVIKKWSNKILSSNGLTGSVVLVKIDNIDKLGYYII